MNWAIDYNDLPFEELIDEFMLSVGKAVYLATAFEKQCQWIVQTIRLVQDLKETGNLEGSLALVASLKSERLVDTLSNLRAGFPSIPRDEVDALTRARLARNAIAHEGANVGSLYCSPAHVAERRRALRSHVSVLAIGDNLVSTWVYEISEKEQAPDEIRRLYPGWVDSWVFGDEERFQGIFDEAVATEKRRPSLLERLKLRHGK